MEFRLEFSLNTISHCFGNVLGMAPEEVVHTPRPLSP